MPAALAHAEVVTNYLRKELELGRIAVVPQHAHSHVHTSSFGVIPKKSGRWRLIVNMSSPHGSSVNDFIDPNLSSLSYVSVDDAAAHTWKSGPGAQLAKLDISEAYRIVPVHPQDRFLHHASKVVKPGRPFIRRLIDLAFQATPRKLDMLGMHQSRCASQL